MRAATLALLVRGSLAASSGTGQFEPGSKCNDIKDIYTMHGCCGERSDEITSFQAKPAPGKMLNGFTNPCEGNNPGFANVDCVIAAVEQSGANVTKGYQGELETDATPINTTLFEAGLCPVNVHWHAGSEHFSAGEYDDLGSGPDGNLAGTNITLMDKPVQHGYHCRKYNTRDEKFTKPYEWKHCTGDMKIGNTYEVHWPHSRLGACGTPNQYQSPFYDGVFCHMNKLVNTAADIGVHAQVFVLVNDEAYYYPNLMRGMIVDGEYGADVAKYTGSTTGQTRNNEICSKYAPITWHVDRKCHLISASSFDAMCADMRLNRDDMSEDLHPHGSRELVADQWAANNHERL